MELLINRYSSQNRIDNAKSLSRMSDDEIGKAFKGKRAQVQSMLDDFKQKEKRYEDRFDKLKADSGASPSSIERAFRDWSDMTANVKDAERVIQILDKLGIKK